VSSDFTGLEISDVNSFISIERNSLSSFKDFDVNWRNVVSRTIDHPSVSRGSEGSVVINGFTSTKEESSFGFKNVDFLEARFKTFSRLQEEGAFSNSELFGSKSDLTINDGVTDDAILSVIQNCDLNLSNDSFLNIRDVGFGFLEGDEPFSTSFSGNSELVNEVFLSS